MERELEGRNDLSGMPGTTDDETRAILGEADHIEPAADGFTARNYRRAGCGIFRESGRR